MKTLCMAALTLVLAGCSADEAGPVKNADTIQIGKRKTIFLNSEKAGALRGKPTFSSGYDGQHLVVLNEGSISTITLLDNSLVAGSRVELSGNANFAMDPGDSITLVYSTRLSKWIETSRSEN